MQNENIEIVIIEDEEDILELIEYHLGKEGYSVTGFLSTENVEKFLEEETPSLMIVDRNLPGMEGSKFVSYLREIGYDIPVIFLTAKDQESELEEGFEAGGDDYMCKPFSPKELTLRVKALLKRSGVLQKQERIKHKALTMDLTKKDLTIDGQTVSLTKLEFNLLHTFKNKIDPQNEQNYFHPVWGVGYKFS
jgi:DNA-binding response OmpR family regulator